jgi:protein-L-isoaspartate(D-aspartate) O-methyltransferase
VALQDRPCLLDDARRRLIERVIVQAHAWRNEIGRAALDPKVLAAVARVPRERFVPEHARPRAHRDEPLDIACGQRISAPSIVAVMTDLLDVAAHHRVLEIGTGCGYQTAVLSQLACAVFSVELEEELALDAVIRLARLDCGNVAVRVGDGSQGWSRHAPFDRIMVTAAVEAVPRALLAQLRPGGRMVLPLGRARASAEGPEPRQRLVALEKLESGGVRRRDLLPVRFIPLRADPMIVHERWA